MYAVLGAAGKVGGEVISVLHREGCHVKAIVRPGSTFTGPAIEAGEADILNPEELARAIDGADTVHVILPTAKPGRDGPAEMRKAIRSITLALETARPERVLAISDYGAHHARGTGMASLFHEMEAELSRLPLKLVLLRSAEHMENWARMAGAAAASSILPSMHHGLSAPFPTVSARDVGAIAGAILLESWRDARCVVHVEGPRRYSTEDIAAAFSLALGHKVEPYALPRSEWISALTRSGMAETTAQSIAEFYDACNAGLIDVEPPGANLMRGRTDIMEVLRGLVVPCGAR